MIQSLPCPGCHRTLVLTADASLNAVLRCRHCSHQFVLGEMIESELGFWEVIDDSNAPEPKAIGIDADAEDSELELAKSEEYISPQALLKKQADKKKVNWSKFEPITHEQYERMRRKGKSPFWSTLSILLGGISSIPIATLLIWHVLGKDPLQMGPVVGRYVPWIVPAQFQSNESDFADVEQQPAGTSGFRRFDDVMSSGTDGSADRVEAERIAAPESESSNNSEFKMPNRTAPRVFSTIEATAPINDNSDQRAEAVEATAGTENSLNNVFVMINQIEKDLQAWNERGQDREFNKKLAFQIYSNLSALALAIDALPAGSPLRRVVRTELHKVGRSVSQQIDIRQLIQFCSRAALTNTRDMSTDRLGLAIVTKIAEATEVESGWEATTAPEESEAPIKLLVPKDIVPSLTQGQSLFVLGTRTITKPTSKTDSAETPVESVSNAESESSIAANYVHVLEH